MNKNNTNFINNGNKICERFQRKKSENLGKMFDRYGNGKVVYHLLMIIAIIITKTTTKIFLIIIIMNMG